MNPTAHIDHLLDDLLDGTLPPAQERDVLNHLQDCEQCQSQWSRLQSLVHQLHQLPESIAPQTDLWSGIESQLSPQLAPKLAPDRKPNRRSRWTSMRHHKKMLIAAGSLFFVSLISLYLISSNPEWEATALAGTPRAGEISFADSYLLAQGDVLQTNAEASVQLQIGEIGEVDLAPNSKLQLVDTDPSHHKLSLSYGKLHAKIWAPPRLFFVETPAGLAIDLGCEYTLEVDSSGFSVLHVTSGYVSFASKSREVIVPAGWKVKTHPSSEPRTPFLEDAPEELVNALDSYSRGHKSTSVLNRIFENTRPEDAYSVWSLIWIAPSSQRPLIYDHLITLTTPEQVVTKEGVLAREPAMIEAWRKHLKIDVSFWLSKGKKKKKRPF